MNEFIKPVLCIGADPNFVSSTRIPFHLKIAEVQYLTVTRVNRHPRDNNTQTQQDALPEEKSSQPFEKREAHFRKQKIQSTIACTAVSGVRSNVVPANSGDCVSSKDSSEQHDRGLSSLNNKQVPATENLIQDNGRPERVSAKKDRKPGTKQRQIDQECLSESVNGSDEDRIREDTPPEVLGGINDHVFAQPQHKILGRYKDCRPEPRSEEEIRGDFNCNVRYASDRARDMTCRKQISLKESKMLFAHDFRPQQNIVSTFETRTGHQQSHSHQDNDNSNWFIPGSRSTFDPVQAFSSQKYDIVASTYRGGCANTQQQETMQNPIKIKIGYSEDAYTRFAEQQVQDDIANAVDSLFKEQHTKQRKQDSRELGKLIERKKQLQQQIIQDILTTDNSKICQPVQPFLDEKQTQPKRQQGRQQLYQDMSTSRLERLKEQYQKEPIISKNQAADFKLNSRYIEKELSSRRKISTQTVKVNGQKVEIDPTWKRSAEMVAIAGEARSQSETEQSEESISTSQQVKVSAREQKRIDIAKKRQETFRNSPLTYTRDKQYPSSTVFYRRRLTSNSTQIANVKDEDLNVIYTEPVMYANPQSTRQAAEYKQQMMQYRKDVQKQIRAARIAAVQDQEAVQEFYDQIDNPEQYLRSQERKTLKPVHLEYKKEFSADRSLPARPDAQLLDILQRRQQGYHRKYPNVAIPDMQK